MKLAIVRQKYTPFGGAERFVERALVALAAKGVDVTMVARQWQGEAASGEHESDAVGAGGFAARLAGGARVAAGAEPDPLAPHRLRPPPGPTDGPVRGASGREAVQRLIAERRFDLLQSHERIPGCDIYRAGDGVHATWLDLRGKPGDRLTPWHRYTMQLAHGAGRHCAPLRPCP